jgi:CDP-diacylglycerol--glycerol-3-phosphate 3-phosphatidyltransferase
MNIANKLTILRVILIPVFIILLFLNIPYYNYYAAGVFIIAALTDLFDGALARKHDMVTNFGKLVDPIADKLLVCSALIVLTAMGWVHSVLVIIIVAREFAVSGLRAVAAAEGKVLAAGMLGKIKTVVQIVAIVAVLLRDGIFGEWIVTLGFILMCASAFMALWSGIDYFVRNKDVVKDMF